MYGKRELESVLLSRKTRQFFLTFFQRCFLSLFLQIDLFPLSKINNSFLLAVNASSIQIRSLQQNEQLV